MQKKSFEKFFGLQETDQLSQEMDHFFTTIIYHAADFSFLHQNAPNSGLFAKNKGIIYAGAQHCKNLSENCNKVVL